MKIGTSYDFWALVYFSKRLYIFQSACIFSERFHIFKALVYFQSACIFSERFHIFKALSYFHGAFITSLSKRFYFLSKRLYLFSPNVSQRLFIFSKCESALFIFFFQEHYSALTLISGCEAHNFLIMI
jgi:hypothetical protein